MVTFFKKVTNIIIRYNTPTTPLYFVRSGYVRTGNGFLRYASENGYFWPSSSAPNGGGDITSSAYSVRFGITGVAPSDGPTYRWTARPLRGLGSGGGSQPSDSMGRLMGWCQ